MKRWICIFPALLCLLTGCGPSLWSNYQPVEELLPVETVGFDVVDGQVQITVSAPGEGSTTQLTARGDTAAAAAENLRPWAGGAALFFPHTRYALLSPEAAERLSSEILPWFTHSGRSRLAIPVFILREGTARALLEGLNAAGQNAGQALEALSPTEQPVTLLELARELRRSGSALCPAVAGGALHEHDPAAAEGALCALNAGYARLRPGVAVEFAEVQP